MNFDTKLFLAVNRLVGQNPWLDALGRAGAEWVVIAMAAWYVLNAYVAYGGELRRALAPVLWLGTAWAGGWFLNVLIGLLVRAPRPHLTHPDSQLLFPPLLNWKSFPSDHAMSAFLIFFMALVFSLPLAWPLLPLALWVAWGRVYAGLHYPFDIVGGAAVAGLLATVSYYILVTL